MARIMTIDDSVTMRTLVSTTLGAMGHQVIEAPDGQQALSLAKGSPVDLFITDLNMPGMDGIALLKAIRLMAAYKYTPVLLLTTEMDPERKKAAKDAGATGWLVKPFDPNQLLATVKRVLG